MSEVFTSAEVVAERSLSRLVGHPRLRYVVLVGALAGAYYGLAKVGYVFEFAGPVAAIVWLPVGIGIAFLALGGLRFWPGVLIGDLLANQYATLPLGTALVQTAGNVLEVVLAAYLIHRIARRGPPLGSVNGLARVFGALALGTAVSATIGPVANWAGGVIETGALPTVWRTWLLADLCGAVVVVPLALAWQRFPPLDWWRRRGLEGALLITAVLATSELVFRGPRPITYAVFPILIWAAFRFGQRGATLAVALTAGLTIWHTTHSVGPFVYHSITRSVLGTQVFILVAAVSTMTLAAVVTERAAFARGLAESRARLVDAGERERRRVEQNLHDGAQLTLTMLAGHLAAARENSARAPEQAPALLEDAEAQVFVAIDQLRELAHGLHPSILTDLGLAEAVRSLVDGSPIPIYILELPSARVDGAAEAAAYYVVAEAVMNAERHAQARSITIRIADRGQTLDVVVADDGVGGANEQGTGLVGLRDRVEAVGGSLELVSPPGYGTRVHAAIAVAKPKRGG